MQGSSETVAIQKAVKHLANTERGRVALMDLYNLFNNGACGLDTYGKNSLILLLQLYLTKYPGTVNDEIAEAIQ